MQIAPHRAYAPLAHRLAKPVGMTHTYPMTDRRDASPFQAAPTVHATAGAYARPVRQPLSGWKVFFIALAAVLIGLVVLPFLMLVFIGAAVSAAVGDLADSGPAPLADGSVLELDLRVPLTDTPAPVLWGAAPPSVSEVTRKLRAAAEDDRIEGVFVRAGFSGMAPATAEAISGALEAVKAEGKFVVAHAQGIENPTLTAYAPFAPAEIWVQEGTGVATAGMRTEAEYYRGLFDKLGVDPEYQQFYEFKSAADTYDETAMTAPVRAQTELWLGSVFDELVEDIARARSLSEDDVRAALQAAPHAPEAAQAIGMIDKVGYLVDAKDRARELAEDEDLKFTPIADYTPKRAAVGSPLVAIISGQGPIVPGASTTNPFGGAPIFGADTVSEAFEKAADNDRVAAIVFRVSSPGGSAAASAQIDDALRRAQAAGKPVVVSMGAYAASGGYYVSANADHIVAEPTTITGSIGVLGGKLALQDAFAKIGYNVDNVEVGGPYAGAYSLDTPFTPEQEAGFRSGMQRIYADFTSLVADARDLSPDEVDALARGRVWTGAQALELGLVDSLGGLDVAIARALELAEEDADDGHRIKIYPETPSFEEQLSRIFQAQTETQTELARLKAILDRPEVQALLQASEAAAPRTDLRATLPDFVD